MCKSINQGCDSAVVYTGAMHPAGASWAALNWPPPCQTNRKPWGLGQVKRIGSSEWGNGIPLSGLGGAGGRDALLESKGGGGGDELGSFGTLCFIFSLCWKPFSISILVYGQSFNISKLYIQELWSYVRFCPTSPHMCMSMCMCHGYVSIYVCLCVLGGDVPMYAHIMTFNDSFPT